MTVHIVESSPTPDQVRAVTEIISRATEIDGTAPISEQAVRAISVGDGSRHLLALDGDDVVGYANVVAAQSDSEDAVDMAEGVVDPEHRGRGVGTALVDAAVTGSGRIWAHGQLPAAVRVAEKLTLTSVRELLQMRRPTTETLPELVVPDGISLRTYRESDDAEILRVNNAAFAWHPEQGGWTQDDIDQRRSEPWFDPAGLFVATPADEPNHVLGFHWTKVHAPEGADPQLGEVYVVGIDPAAQGRGLGRLLTLAGLHYLESKGPAVLLYVESDNSAAVHTYDRLGFTRFHVDVAYARA
ncbi:mycothiol acetyltransferase [Rhodococcoides trifolii]|uniref:Mycothiol acetyltransferase n=1 Tax=Rhodococcoides trifolii TaxID=908250 RepID=A0A917G4V9_9NOCA|nr:mycothiol synthase [Rhodococcus trifolii]GGG22991.1 mycothiol acetyltransferase [Rhodococcus trifolii]